MPKIRRKLSKDFTIISNKMLRDTRLGCMERGILLTMLSLPDNWNFSIRGLARILPDGCTKISGALKKLESAGYLVRRKIYTDGKISDCEYIFSDEPIFTEISETPADETEIQQNVETDIENNIENSHDVESDVETVENNVENSQDVETDVETVENNVENSQDVEMNVETVENHVENSPETTVIRRRPTEKQHLENLDPENLNQENQHLENRINNKIKKDKESNNKISYNKESIDRSDRERLTDRYSAEQKKYTGIVKKNILYDEFSEWLRIFGEKYMTVSELDDIVRMMVREIISRKPKKRICGEEYPRAEIKAAMLRTDRNCIETAIEKMRQSDNIKSYDRYFISTLFNEANGRHFRRQAEKRSMEYAVQAGI